MKKGFFVAALAILAACGEDPDAAGQKADSEEIANFLAERDPPRTVTIERQIDVKQSGDLLKNAPVERSQDVARELAER